MGCSPESVLLVAISLSICCLILRLVFLRRMVGLSVSAYLRNVCLNVFSVTFVSVIIPVCVKKLSNDVGWIHFLLVSFICVVCSLVSVYVVGCSKKERQFITQKIVSFKQKITG